MASRRKGWSELSPAYRQRLERHEITQSGYAEGGSLRAARGHSRTPERITGYEKLGLELGMGYVVPAYSENREALTAEERGRIARDYVLGFMTPGSMQAP